LKSVLYRDHLIIYGASLDPWSGYYAPTGQITCHAVNGKPRKHCFTLSRLCAKSAEADTIALEEAILWTDERIAGLGV
jgi:hypothetical protein